MALYAVDTDGSVRLLSSFRKHLRTTVFTTVWLAASAACTLAQELPKYVNADGTRANDVEAAKQSWRDDAEFNGNDGLGAINADAAYAAGYTGKGASSA